MSDPTPAGSSARSGEDRDELLAADRRTMIVAAIAVAALLLVGIVAASVFARSACERIAPEPTEAGVAAADPAPVLEAAFDEDAAVTGGGFEAVAARLADHLGPGLGAADVTGAAGLVEVAGGFAATGPVTSVLEPSGAAVSAAASFDDATVVGDGSPLYSLALVNEVTGQVDALQPVDTDLDGHTCVDTATVGTPLAFHLAAGGGELLLLRADEAGEDVDVELRDEVQGRVWRTRIDLETAPAGTLGARLDASLGADLAVVARRTVPGDGLPVALGLDRSSGEIVWEADRAGLPPALEDQTWRADVVAVSSEVALLTLMEDQAGIGAARLVALDATDGAVLWQEELAADAEVADATTGDDGGVGLLRSGGGGWQLTAAGAAGTRMLAEGNGRGTAAAVTDAGTYVVASDRGVSIVDADGSTTTVDTAIPAIDVLVAEGTTVLFADTTGAADGREAGGAVTVTFGGR